MWPSSWRNIKGTTPPCKICNRGLAPGPVNHCERTASTSTEHKRVGHSCARVRRMMAEGSMPETTVANSAARTGPRAEAERVSTGTARPLVHQGLVEIPRPWEPSCGPGATSLQLQCHRGAATTSAPLKRNVTTPVILMLILTKHAGTPPKHFAFYRQGVSPRPWYPVLAEDADKC